MLRCKGDNLLQVLLAFREGYSVGNPFKRAEAKRNPVGKALTMGMPDPFFRVGNDKGIVRQTGFRDIADKFFKGNIPLGSARSDDRAKELGAFFRQVHGD